MRLGKRPHSKVAPVLERWSETSEGTKDRRPVLVRVTTTAAPAEASRQISACGADVTSSGPGLVLAEVTAPALREISKLDLVVAVEAPRELNKLDLRQR